MPGHVSRAESRRGKIDHIFSFRAEYGAITDQLGIGAIGSGDDDVVPLL